MIPKSLLYKLARKSDGVIIAEGNAKEMRALRKKTPGTQVWISSPKSALGQTIGKEK